MKPKELFDQLRAPRANKPELSKQVLMQPDLIESLLQGLDQPEARVRFGSARLLEFVAAQNAGLLSPHFDRFARLFDQEESPVLRWEAIRILACLSTVDCADHFEKMFRRFFAPIKGPVMITAANLIATVPTIASAHPEWADRLARQILHVETGQYQTPECRNVAIGHALKSLKSMFPLLRKPAPVWAFIHRQRQNSRAATRRKAEALLARPPRNNHCLSEPTRA